MEGAGGDTAELKKTAESLTAPESIFKEQSGGNIDSWIMGAGRDAAELKKQQNP